MNQIRKLRELRNYTQNFMAAKLGMSQSNYARIEKGSIKISKELLLKIAKILNVNIDTITKFNENEFLKNNQPDILKSTNSHSNNSTEILLLHIHELYKAQISQLENRIKFQETLLSEKLKFKK